MRTMLFPFSPILRNPVEFSSGVSLFATQTTVLSSMVLYHMAKYQAELVKEKKPNSKIPFGDERVWLVLRNWVVVKVSAELVIVEKKVSRVENQKRKMLRRLLTPPMFGEGKNLGLYDYCDLVSSLHVQDNLFVLVLTDGRKSSAS